MLSANTECRLTKSQPNYFSQMSISVIFWQVKVCWPFNIVGYFDDQDQFSNLGRLKQPAKYCQLIKLLLTTWQLAKRWPWKHCKTGFCFVLFCNFYQIASHRFFCNRHVILPSKLFYSTWYFTLPLLAFSTWHFHFLWAVMSSCCGGVITEWFRTKKQ